MNTLFYNKKNSICVYTLQTIILFNCFCLGHVMYLKWDDNIATLNALIHKKKYRFRLRLHKFYQLFIGRTVSIIILILHLIDDNIL